MFSNKLGYLACIILMSCWIRQGGSQKAPKARAGNQKATKARAEFVSPLVLGFRAPVIKKFADLAGNEGRLVTLHGQIGWSKIPGLVGVEVSCHDDALRGKTCYATGILIKHVPAKRVKDDAEKPSVPQAHSPGMFNKEHYKLYRDIEWRLAEAHPVTTESK